MTEPLDQPPDQPLDLPLDLDQMRARIELPDPELVAAAAARHGTLAKPVGSLGRLEDIAGFFASVQGTCPPHELERARVVVFAADHGVAAAGVSAYPTAVTAQMLAAIAAGTATVSVFARLAGATVRVEDLAVDADTPEAISTYKIRRGNGRIDRENALTPEETERAFAAGVAIVDDEVDSGTDLLITGDMGIGNTTPAAAIVAASLGLEPTAVTGRGSGIDDATYMRKIIAVRDALRRSRDHRYDPLELVGCCGGADFAAMTGFLMQAAVRRTPVLLDGLMSAAAALLARDLAYDAAEWWFASHRSPEPAHAAALESLGLTPLLDLDLRLGEGTGALAALPLIRQAIAALREVATLEEAGSQREGQR